MLRRVLECDPSVRFSVSHTTREPRLGERDGKDYFFIDDKRFRALIDDYVATKYPRRAVASL